MNDDVDTHAARVHRRDAARLVRLVVVALIVAALVAIALDNRDDARLGYVVGDASAPTWIVIVGAAVAGAVIGWLVRQRSRHLR